MHIYTEKQHRLKTGHEGHKHTHTVKQRWVKFQIKSLATLHAGTSHWRASSSHQLVVEMHTTSLPIGSVLPVCAKDCNAHHTLDQLLPRHTNITPGHSTSELSRSLTILYGSMN